METPRKMIEDTEQALRGLADTFEQAAKTLRETAVQGSDGEKGALFLTVMPAIEQFVEAMKQGAYLSSLIGGAIDHCGPAERTSKEDIMSKFARDLNTFRDKEEQRRGDGGR